ncbi:uncharacterized protein CCOS01_02360 [Colletotrichum costaricense]|uniref:Uncharacterized protein n=1 Tax=Colletotrichum costaricense TaxID=1209916 RepID=A0AAJ0E733_9PEZI|nr:uncharacterized protein CCOS01_02360 [Colletotrichum costaricense]KAK1537040.1 hypothetical protein CCOS01_02360 [Colletotrichum costaricense]
MQPRSRLGAFRLPVKGMVAKKTAEVQWTDGRVRGCGVGQIPGTLHVSCVLALGDSERTDWRREAVAKKKGKRGGQRELELELHWLPLLPMLRSGFACWDPRHTCTEYRGPIHSSGEAAGPSACGFDGNISQHHRNSTANVEAPSWAGPQSNLFANAKLKRFRNGHSLQDSGVLDSAQLPIWPLLQRKLRFALLWVPVRKCGISLLKLRGFLADMRRSGVSTSTSVDFSHLSTLRVIPEDGVHLGVFANVGGHTDVVPHTLQQPRWQLTGRLLWLLQPQDSQTTHRLQPGNVDGAPIITEAEAW